MFSCNENNKKEKNSFIGIWTTQYLEHLPGVTDFIMHQKFTIYSNGSYSIYSISHLQPENKGSLTTGTWEEKNGQICFTEEGGFCWCIDYLWISKNQWEYTDERGESGFLTRQ